MVMFSQYQVKSLVKRGCWIQLARFMQHQRRSGSRHTLRRMMVLGDDSDYRIIGVGDIKFKMCDGREMLLKGVK